MCVTISVDYKVFPRIIIVEAVHADNNNVPKHNRSHLVL